MFFRLRRPSIGGVVSDSCGSHSECLYASASLTTGVEPRSVSVQGSMTRGVAYRELRLLILWLPSLKLDCLENVPMEMIVNLLQRKFE